MPPRKDLVGQQFGRLTVVEFAGINKKRNALWLCKCECGGTKTVTSYELTHSLIKSCGCLSKENLSILHTNNLIHGLANSRTFKIWVGMKQRCLNPNNSSYFKYGGRGITVAPRWINSFENFLEDMKEAPAGCSIERIDNNGDYEPGNCKWSNPKEQARNRRSSYLITYQGRTQSLAAWAEELDIKYVTLRARLEVFKWTVEQSFTTPTVDTSKVITWQGETKKIGEWAKQLNIPRQVLSNRFQKGWSVERVLTTSYQGNMEV